MAALTALRRRLVGSIGRKPAPLNSRLSMRLSPATSNRLAWALGCIVAFRNVRGLDSSNGGSGSTLYVTIDPFTDVSSGSFMPGDTNASSTINVKSKFFYFSDF